MVVRCTKKMLDLLGGRSVTLVDLAPSDDDWCLNLLWLERRKCLLLTHSGTLFSVFRADIRSADLRPLGKYLVDAIEAELRVEQLPIDTFSALAPASVLLAKTASRRTLGFMNEMVAELEYAIPAAGGLSACDIGALNRRLRRTLHNRGGYVTPIELVETKRPVARPERERGGSCGTRPLVAFREHASTVVRAPSVASEGMVGAMTCPYVSALGDEDDDWLRAVLLERWGGEPIVGRGRAHRVDDLEGIAALIGDERVGVLTYRIDVDVCEIVTLDAFREGVGVGRALIEAVTARARAAGASTLLVMTTNDNVGALRFYQRAGFRLDELRSGAVDEARRVKPTIPLIGHDHIPIRDELDLVRNLSDDPSGPS